MILRKPTYKMFANTYAQLPVGSRSIYLCLLFLSLPFFCLSQKGRIVGKVVDDQTGVALSYATVQVFQQSDGALLTGGITGEAGTFAIESPMGELKATVDFIGYQSYDIGTFTLSTSQRKLDVGVIIQYTGEHSGCHLLRI